MHLAKEEEGEKGGRGGRGGGGGGGGEVESSSRESEKELLSYSTAMIDIYKDKRYILPSFYERYAR